MTPILTVLATALVALIGVYFREAIRHAQKQQVVARRISAYLADWRDSFLDSDDLLALFSLGIERDNAKKNVALTGSLDDWKEICSSQKKELEDIKEALLNANDETKNIFHQQFNNVKTMDEASFDLLIGNYRDHKESIWNGTGFVTDSEAAVLSGSIAADIVKVRYAISYLMHNVIASHLLMRNMNVFEFEKLVDTQTVILKTTIQIAERYNSLDSVIQFYLQKSPFKLAFDYMLMRHQF